MDSLPVRICSRRLSLLFSLAVFSVVALTGCPSEPTSGEPGGGDVTGEDVGDSDAESNDDSDNDEQQCQGEAAFQLCDEDGAECGNLDVVDSCDEARTVDCGECDGAESCGEGDAGPNECGCQALTDEDCESEGLFCGTYPDGCGGEFDCGSCDEDGEECQEQDDGYVCSDTPCEPMGCSDVVDGGAECGEYADGCGGIEDCGECDGDDVCEDGQCICQFEGVDAFCDEADVECGSLQGIDNCGEQRTEYCGGCGLRPCVGGECGLL